MLEITRKTDPTSDDRFEILFDSGFGDDPQINPLLDIEPSEIPCAGIIDNILQVSAIGEASEFDGGEGMGQALYSLMRFGFARVIALTSARGIEVDLDRAGQDPFWIPAAKELMTQWAMGRGLHEWSDAAFYLLSDQMDSTVAQYFGLEGEWWENAEELALVHRGNDAVVLGAAVAAAVAGQRAI